MDKPQRTYHIITFGCQMNERDSETLAGMLEEKGYCYSEDYTHANLVLLNTCSVRENADKRFFGTLGQLKHHKEEDPSFVVGVCGCMMQQKIVVDQVVEKYPWVDMVFGTGNLSAFPALLEQVLDAPVTEHKMLIDVPQDPKEVPEGLPQRRLHSHKAFVNIMYGCNNFCTYCIVPYTRGRERSRKAADVVQEVEKLVQDGVKEITLLGQNVNSYRDQDKDFTDLLQMLHPIQGLERIRFMTSHPKDISDKLIQAFPTMPKLCNNIHLPVQAGSDEILKRMNRHYTREDYYRIVEKLRESTPDITMSTDIIVGFPGETEEDFEKTLELVEWVDYDSAFTFLYSIRPGTPAATYDNQVPEDIKHQRFNRLVEAVDRHSFARNQAYLGKVVEVMVDGESKRNAATVAGRTQGFKLVNFEGRGDEQPGDLVQVRITEAKTFSLVGERI